PWNLADVGSQPIGRQRRHAGTVFHFSDGTWRLDGLRHDHLLHHGLRLFRRRDCARPSSPGESLGVDRLLDRFHRRVDGARSDPHGSGLGPLYVLSPAHRQPLVLYRARARGGRFVGMVRSHARRDARVEARKSRPACAAGHVRDGGKRAVVALDHCRCGGRTAVSSHPGRVGGRADPRFMASPDAVVVVDAGLARTLFSWTLHAIVYFWLIPAYIAFYTIVPRAAGGRLYSDTMGRLTFILFLLYSLPVGMHHLLMDPEHGNGWKFIQVLL